MRKNTSGFTIVELLIVIVVIGILAAITLVAYNGVQQKARSATMKSDLSNAAKQMELAKVDSADGSYPTSLPSSTRASNGNVMQLTYVTDPATYCINLYAANGQTMSFHSKDSFKSSLCDGANMGTPAGGTTPAVPKNANLVADFSAWAASGNMTYNSSSNEMVCGSGSGYANSPLVRVDGASSARLTVEAYSTAASPQFTPNGGVLASSYYYGSDGTTPAQSSSSPSYTGNGNAQQIALNSWAPYGWSTTTGSLVMYVKFRVECSPANYTSAGQRYRNPAIMAL